MSCLCGNDLSLTLSPPGAEHIGVVAHGTHCIQETDMLTFTDHELFIHDLRQQALGAQKVAESAWQRPHLHAFGTTDKEKVGTLATLIATDLYYLADEEEKQTC